MRRCKKRNEKHPGNYQRREWKICLQEEASATSQEREGEGERERDRELHNTNPFQFSSHLMKKINQQKSTLSEKLEFHIEYVCFSIQGTKTLRGEQHEQHSAGVCHLYSSNTLNLHTHTHTHTHTNTQTQTHTHWPLDSVLSSCVFLCHLYCYTSKTLSEHKPLNDGCRVEVVCVCVCVVWQNRKRRRKILWACEREKVCVRMCVLWP